MNGMPGRGVGGSGSVRTIGFFRVTPPPIEPSTTYRGPPAGERAGERGLISSCYNHAGGA